MSFVNKPLTDILDCVRASTATYVDATGRIRTAGVNQPRIDFSSGQGRLLTEETRTNLVTWSEDFSKVSWVKASPYSVSSNAGTSPSGAMDADAIIVANGANSFNVNVVRQVVSKPSEYITYTRSGFFKALGVTDSVRLTDFGATTSDSISCIVSLINGQVISGPSPSGNFSNASVDVQPYPNNWFKVSLTYTTDNNPSVTIRNFPYVDTSALIGDDSSGVLVWGIQLEQGSTPSSYIPTEASAVTRAADNVSRVVGDEFNNDEGTLFLELGGEVVPSSATDFGYIYRLFDGTSANRIFAVRRRSGGYSFYITADGVQQDSFTNLPLGQINKVAVVYSKANNTCATYVDGVLRNSGTFAGFSSNLTELQLGIGIGGVEFKGVKFYPKALSDAECQELTKI